MEEEEEAYPQMGMWHQIVEYIFTNILKECDDSIYMVKDSSTL